mmetsp:Transcript_80077/g.166565  ORF Transcript_80077/g.166565 Transcript_80077/m.166565 type:complete len:590 (+) Transcript_80077:260-2029(+)
MLQVVCSSVFFVVFSSSVFVVWSSSCWSSFPSSSSSSCSWIPFGSSRSCCCNSICWMCFFFLLLGVNGTSEVRYCSYDCSSSNRPATSGRCYEPKEVFDTNGVDWYVLRLRDDTMAAGDRHVLTEWASFASAEMTWEGWFKMTSAPVGKNTLMGTYGANHDYTAGGTRAVYDAGSSRRRYAAVSIDPDGSISFATNAGSSTGELKHDISLKDGSWHHIAAVFSNSGGGQISFSFRMVWIDYDKLMNRETVQADFILALRTTIAEIAGSGTTVEEVSVTLSDGLVKPTPVFWEYATTVDCTINSRPDLVEPRSAELASSKRITENVVAAAQAVTNIRLVVADEYTSEDIEARTEEVVLPTSNNTGMVSLLVDGYEAQDGWVNYAQLDDNVGLDGEFVIGGGRLGIAFGCQVSRVRLWNRMLSAEQLRALYPCFPPSINEVVGGESPYGLILSWDFDGSIANTAPDTSYFSVNLVDGREFEYSVVNYDAGADLWAQPDTTSAFVEGGPCHYDGCPTFSPPVGRHQGGCPLSSEREVRFKTLEKCEEFAAFRFCRSSGPSRGHAANPVLNGCHAGGPFAWKGQPLSWHNPSG